MTGAATARRIRLASPLTALVLGVLVLLLAAALIPLSILGHQNPLANTSIPLAIALPFAAVGVVVARRQPRNPIGWLMLAPAVCVLAGVDAGAYDVIDYRLGHHLPLFGPEALLLSKWWALLLALLPLIVLLFPDGHLPSPRWRWVLWPYLALGLAFTGSLTAIAAYAIASHHFRVDHLGELVVLDQSGGAGGGVIAATFVLFLAFWLSFAARQVVTWRRASGDRRQQFTWLVSSGAVCIVFLVGSVIIGGHQGIWQIISTILSMGFFIALPVGMGVGILRYRLYDIDRIISRTLAYAIVTGLLVGVYAGLVLLATRVLKASSPVSVAASTLAGAALFNPLRRRVQRVVDRRFNRARYDADKTVAAFAARLQDAVDLDSVRDELAGVVHQALEPAHVSVWISQRA